MKKLENNWFMEGLLDFEYKKYILLAYLQDVDKHFVNKCLYPSLADLVAQYQNLLSFKSKKDSLFEAFPEKVEGADWKNFKLNYHKIIEDDKLMNEISEIINYSIPMVKTHLEKGKEIYEFIEEKLEIFPVGLIPLQTNEGYLLILNKNKKDTSVYEYSISIFESNQEKYRGINTTFVRSYSNSFVNTFENIKVDLIKQIQKFPNPAVYGVEGLTDYPLEETILPIAKRSLVKFLS